jgi:uncharacterized iron-regulated protein
MERRTLLAAALAFGLAGCAHGTQAPTLREAATGRRIGLGELHARIQGSDHVLMGELHDHPAHHLLRAQWLAALPFPVSVVAEHLPRGAAPALPTDADAAVLLRGLEEAGFDPKGWQWPLHRPLFMAIAQGRHRLRGGNLPRDLARRAAREGLSALPDELRRLVEAAPLPAATHAALLAALQASHCGHLPAQRLPAMLVAQRGRDAAMAWAMRESRSEGRRGPVLLLAGNGHVRRDVGVPQLLAAMEPEARLLSVGLVELGDAPLPGAYDIVCTVPPIEREDPCEGLRKG